MGFWLGRGTDGGREGAIVRHHVTVLESNVNPVLGGSFHFESVAARAFAQAYLGAVSPAEQR